MGSAARRTAWLPAAALALGGTWLLATSVRNNPLEGWGMLLRALAGHGLCIAAAGYGADATGRSSRDARIVAAMALSAVLTPAAALVLLMSKESGASWSLAALILVAYFGGSGVAAFVARRRSRP